MAALGAATLLAGCGQSGSEPAANQAANVAKPAVHHFCFFKPAETRSWKVAGDGKGNVTVTGKAHLKDPRYKAELGQPEVAGENATLWLSMQPNMTGFAAEDDWWDVSFTIPDAGAVRTVAVRCDDKRTLAILAYNH
jgi:hypothetical protein